MMKFTTIQVARVANGWIVLSGSAQSFGGTGDDAIVVGEGEDLGGAIAAALVAGKLKAADVLAQKIAPQSAYSYGAMNSVAHAKGLGVAIDADHFAERMAQHQDFLRRQLEDHEQAKLAQAAQSVKNF